MTFLVKKADDNMVDYNLFKSSLRKYSNSDGNNNSNVYMYYHI